MHLLCTYQNVSMERQRREEEIKSRSSKKAPEADQSILNRVGSLLILIYSLSLNVVCPFKMSSSTFCGYDTKHATAIDI